MKITKKWPLTTALTEELDFATRPARNNILGPGSTMRERTVSWECMTCVWMTSASCQDYSYGTEALNCSVFPRLLECTFFNSKCTHFELLSSGTLYWMKSKKIGSWQFVKVGRWRLERAELLSAGMGATEGFAVHKKTARMTAVSLTCQWTQKPALIKPTLVVLTRCCWCCLNEDMAFCVLHWRDIY